MPCHGALQYLHGIFAEVVANNFLVPSKAFLNPYELAAVSNYIAMFGSTSKKKQDHFNLSETLNALKSLWTHAEQDSAYSDDPDHAATFVLKWVYQQIPYHVHPLRVVRVWSIMKNLISDPDVSSVMEQHLNISGSRFATATMRIMGQFQKAPFYPESDLLRAGDSPDIWTTLKHLSADRPKRLAFHRAKLERTEPREKPYEINSLLRYPIIHEKGQYLAPYPELIGYAGTRGLFFRLSQEAGDHFREPFVRAFERLTADMLRGHVLGSEILTEQDERDLGWAGKTNDVTLISADTAVLVECKLSGLFVEAKMSASPEAIIADVKKQIADGKDRRGLFQLHEKIAAIRSGRLPAALSQKYAKVTSFYPVLLLFDAIEHANAPLMIGNVIRDQLSAHGVSGFQYQIWHVEELSWLIDLAGPSLIEWVTEKFSPTNYVFGLNTFLGKKTNQMIFQPPMYMPQNTRAFDILKRLSDLEN